MARRYYTTYEASHFLGVSLPTVVNWIKAGRLKAHRTPGGHRRIARDELASFIRRHGMPMPPELAEEGAQARILVVADAKQVDALATLVKRAAFEANAAASAFAAGLAVGGFKPDLVLVDLTATGFDGFALLAELRANPGTRKLPAMAVLGAKDDKLARKAMTAGFDDHLVRPVEVEQLRRKLEQALRTKKAA